MEQAKKLYNVGVRNGWGYFQTVEATTVKEAKNIYCRAAGLTTLESKRMIVVEEVAV